ncbi:MAG: hypothetical protein WAN36_00675 [Calditrichia bacterium]
MRRIGLKKLLFCGNLLLILLISICRAQSPVSGRQQQQTGKAFLINVPDSLQSAPTDLYYSGFPYHLDGEGWYSPFSTRTTAVRLSGHYYFQGSAFQGVHFSGMGAPVRRFGFRGYYDEFAENYKGGYRYQRDYGIGAEYHIFRRINGLILAGLGAAVWQQTDTQYFPTIHVAAEYYLKKPWSFQLFYIAGKPDQGNFSIFRFTFSFHFYRSSFYIGYNYLSFSRDKKNGIIAGSRIFF